MGTCAKCGVRKYDITTYCGDCYRQENKTYWKEKRRATKVKNKQPKKHVFDDVTKRAALVLQANGVQVFSPSPKKLVKAICDFKSVPYVGVTKGQARIVLQKFANTGELELPNAPPIAKKKYQKKFKKNGDFFMSPEWRTLRYMALNKYGKQCMCCGAKAGNGIVLHVDHIKPRSKFPNLALDITNLQILCEDCNLGKGAWDQTDHRPQLKVIEGGKVA